MSSAKCSANCFTNPEHTGNADYVVASEGYFESLGIPLLRGRLFNGADGPTAPHAAVISESVARLKWPNQDPIGQTVEFGNMDGDRNTEAWKLFSPCIRGPARRTSGKTGTVSPNAWAS